MGRNKQNNNNNFHAVFSVKPIRESNSAMLKCVGHVEGDSNITDRPLICNKSDDKSDDKYIYKVTDTIYAIFFHCNIKDSYVMVSKTLPVMYASIMHQTEIISGLLFNIFIDFVIESEIKNEKQLIGTKLYGKYQLRIKINDNETPKIIQLDQFDNTDFIIDVMKNIIETDEMKSIIAKVIESRRKERSDKFGSIDQNIKIPKPKYNFSELVRQYEKNGTIDI